MSTTAFLIMLSAFSVLASLVTEAIKKIIQEKDKQPYNIIALVSALVIGCIGTATYYQLNGIEFTLNNIIYMVLMGGASGLVSMVGFDKVKQAIAQFTNKTEE